MDNRTTYSKLAKMIFGYKGETLTTHDLRVMIIKEIGSDERCIQKCMKLMLETGLIKDIDNSRFQIL